MLPDTIAAGGYRVPLLFEARPKPTECSGAAGCEATLLISAGDLLLRVEP